MTPQPEPQAGMALFLTDDAIAAQLRAVAAELRVVASRRRCHELAADLDRLAAKLDPAGTGVA